MTVVVVSPHLDDAAWSIGATLHAVSLRGVPVRVVTVFAGDPDRSGAPSYWVAERGVETAGAAVALRRDEDLAASLVLGYEPVWLPFDDSGYVYNRDPEQIMAAVRPHLADASVVVVPGWPLQHMDHRYAAMMMIERVTDKPILMYAELPYSASPRNLAVARLRGRTGSPLRNATGGEVIWSSSQTPAADRAAKRAAIACYCGEVSALGYRARISAIYERIVGREILGHQGPTDLHVTDWTEALADGGQIFCEPPRSVPR